MRELNRLSVGQHLHVNLARGNEGLRPANEGNHAPVWGERGRGRSIGEAGNLHPVVARRGAGTTPRKWIENQRQKANRKDDKRDSYCTYSSTLKPWSLVQALRFRRTGCHPRFGARTAFLDDLDRCDQTIPAPGQGFDKPRIFSIIAERFAQLLHSGINAVFKIDKGIVGPEFSLNLFPGYHFPGTFKESGKNLERPLLEPDLVAIAPQFSAAKVNFELSDAEARIRCCWLWHGGAYQRLSFDLTGLQNRGQAGR